ncbi:hypothetical protein [Dactylosporangium matsuzakiense]|uniref:hypothetical protein n=1 Tax=Dactylosporangium matsuzakiense TaxID=53360 RepID=UPI0021C3C53D|nr:hypothetical protein [Dactylosporangium matsuzakiense]
MLGRLLLGVVDDHAGLLLGQREDLVDHRAEVAEGCAVDAGGPLAHLVQLRLQLLDLVGQVLHLVGQILGLAGGALAIGGEVGDLPVELVEVLVDLAFVVTSDLLGEGGPSLGPVALRQQIPAVGHERILHTIGKL